MPFLWGFLYNLILTLLVINVMIWLRAKRQTPQSDAPAMFGAVANSFGGADFLGAALVVVISIVGTLVTNALARTATADLVTDLDSPPAVNMAVAWLIQGIVVAANAAVISWRNRQFLDWKWSVAAAVLIVVVASVVALVFMVLTSL